MCESSGEKLHNFPTTVPVKDAVGSVLAHDITEIRPGEFKGCAFRKGHIIREEDVCHLQRIGKERLFVLKIGDDELHEDDAAHVLARALMGEGVAIKGEPREGKITIVAERDGLLKVREDALLEFNLPGDVMCATLHNNTLVKKGQTVAATRAVPLVVKKKIVEDAARVAAASGGVVGVKGLRRPRAGIVITGNEVYYGRIRDAFAPVITGKVEAFGGEVTGIYYAPDEEAFIESRLRELVAAGADLLITTGGMSVDPDDVTRFAIRRLGATDITYGSAVLPGAMFLVAYLEAGPGYPASETGNELLPESDAQIFGPRSRVPVLGIPACGIYSRTTVFDLVLPRVLAGERIGRRELAELGHGGLCLKCDPCRYPVCPFGK
jgi:Probable molybdopterin binding domain